MVTKKVTDLKVSPSDWLTNPQTINKPWQIWYRYQGELVKVMGMNREKDYSLRVQLTLQILKEEETKLKKYGFNPLNKTFLISPPEQPNEIASNNSHSFVDALNEAYKNLKVEYSTLLSIKSCLKYIGESAIRIKLKNLPIKEICKRHLKLLMNDIDDNRNLSPRNWNVYRSYLMMLFEQLDELELVDHNPAKELKKRKEVIKFRTVLTPHEREIVKSHLLRNYPNFYRFIQIFFHSGSRITELLSLQIKDVDLLGSQFKILIKKGKQKRVVAKVIKDIAKPYWEEQIRNGNPNDYVFSINLLPGVKKIRKEQITRRWKVHVKDKLGIKADFYSLKHLNTDETAALIDIEAAARQNGHTSSQITKKHYAFGEYDRHNRRLKCINNEL